MRLLVACGTIVVISCATPQQPTFSEGFELIVSDNPGMERFDLQLRGGTSPLCMGIDQWPDRLGRVAVGNQRAVATTDNGRFPARGFNFGYCRGSSCTIRIPVRTQISGSVAYSEFPPEAGIRSSSSRRLEYMVHPYNC